MNVKRPLNIALFLATSIALMSVGCNAKDEQYKSLVSPHMQQQDTTSNDFNSTNREDFTFGDNPSSQSRYEITFTKFYIEKEELQEDGQSDYLFEVYDHKTKAYKKKCFNDVKSCNNKVDAKKGNTVSLNVTVSNVSDYVYLMILEADDDKRNVLNKIQNTSMPLVFCPYHEKTTHQCLKIPVQYLYKNRYSCLRMATKSRNDEICLYYDIEKQQKLHLDFQNHLESLEKASTLSLSFLFGGKLVKFFEKNFDYNKGQPVSWFDFLQENELKNQVVSSVTFYAYKHGLKAFSGLPTEIAQPVVNYLSKNYPSGLWVINGADGALAAYGADQLNEYPSSIRIGVDWPQGISDESINKWLKTPEKGQVYRPYHTIKLVYRKGDFTVAELMTKFNPMAYHENDRFDTLKTLPNTLTLPGRYTFGKDIEGKHINKVEVELSGIFSLLKSKINKKINGNISIHLEPQDNISVQLDLPDGYKYECQAISKTVPEWFKTNTIMLQCPRLPKSLIEPDFVDGKVRLNASRKELFLGLRFENQQEQTSLKGWRIGNTTITQSGTQDYMLVNARDLPQNGQLMLLPPDNAFSIFYLNEPITVELSKKQQNYLYTAKSVPELDGDAAINLEVPNPKERPIETFKDSDNPWTPEKLTFLCDMTQSEKELCKKTCTLESTNVPKSVGLICEGKKQKMPLKDLKGYWIISRFLGRYWKNEIPLAKLNSEESLKNFFCGAWHLLFPVEDMVIVVGSKEHKEEIRNAQLRNTIQHNTQKQKQIKFRYTTKDDKQYIWYDFLDSSGNWQLDSVLGSYDYYLHQDYACDSYGKPLNFLTHPDKMCTDIQKSQSSLNCKGYPIDSHRQQSSSATTQGNTAQIQGNTAQIDIVAVFANNYDFQQQPAISSIVQDLDLDISQTYQKELEAGWMRTWNKPTTQSSLHHAITQQASKQHKRNPWVKLHYHYYDGDKKGKWLWSPVSGQFLDNSPSIMKRRDMAKVVNISDVVLEDKIFPDDNRLDNQVTKIITHITSQWQPNGDYLLVILSDGISEYEMAQLKNIKLPRGHGKRQLLVLTSDFLPIKSQSVLSLPELPSNTGPHQVISMYDEKWIEKFVETIFNF